MSKTSIEWLAEARLQRCRASAPVMGTRWTAQFHAPPECSVAAIVRDLASSACGVDAQMSNWRADSDLSRLNRGAPGTWVPVPPDLAGVLARALGIARDSGNAFNVAVGALVNAWGFGPEGGKATGTGTAAQPCLPLDEVLEVDAANCRARRRAAVSLDLCGIAKGFGVDQLMRVLDRHQIDSALVGIDGEMRAKGRKPGGTPWTIAIEAPSFERREAMSVIELGDAAIATSGDYRHWRQIGRARISHTMDPRTGAPARSGLASVTVVAPDCTEADALATALMVLGPDHGIALARRLDLQALLVSRDGDALVSHGTGCFS